MNTSSLLRQAITAGAVMTLTYSSGLQISGVPVGVSCEAHGELPYIRIKGPVILSYLDRPLAGFPAGRYPNGFCSPLGPLKAESLPLEFRLFECGQWVSFHYTSGILVTGIVQNLLREDFKNILITLTDCMVIDRRGAVLHSPEQGDFDLAVGDRIVAVQPVPDRWTDFAQEDNHE